MKKQSESEISKICAIAKAYKSNENSWQDNALAEKLTDAYLFITAYVTGWDVGEHCLRYDFTMEESVLENLTCHMCDLPVHVGDEATLLFSVDELFPAENEKDSRYLLHRFCADKFCRDEQNELYLED